MNLERMGIPAVLVVAEQFVAAAQANARAQGMPDIAMVVVPADYLEEDAARARATIEPVVDEILERLFVRSG